MKTSFWRRHWVFGFCTDIETASKVVSSAKEHDFPSRKICVITPQSVRRKRIAHIKPEAKTPELMWMLNGALIGAFVAALLGWIISGDLFHGAIRVLPAFFTAVGGAITGTFFALLLSGADASLHQHYYDGNYEKLGKILIGIACKPHDLHQIQTAQIILEKHGIQSHEM